jgi:NADH dehydrogenase (ubiquinone) 1 beta subcomplex subunit 7
MYCQYWLVDVLNMYFIYKKYLEMKITKEELAKAKVPLHLRDYCAHLVVPLLECQKKNYYLPWKCKHERHDWEVCEYTE